MPESSTWSHLIGVMGVLRTTRRIDRTGIFTYTFTVQIHLIIWAMDPTWQMYQPHVGNYTSPTWIRYEFRSPYKVGLY